MSERPFWHVSSCRSLIGTAGENKQRSCVQLRHARLLRLDVLGLALQLKVWGWAWRPRLGAVVCVRKAEALPIKPSTDKEIQVPGLWADANKSAAAGSQGFVDIRSCKNIFSSLTCHPWSRDASPGEGVFGQGGFWWKELWGLVRGPRGGNLPAWMLLFEGRLVVMWQGGQKGPRWAPSV